MRSAMKIVIKKKLFQKKIYNPKMKKIKRQINVLNFVKKFLTKL